MIVIDEDLHNHYQQDTTTLCQIVRIERIDGVVVGLTNLDEDLVFEDEPDLVYRSKIGFTPLAISSSNSLSVDNLEIEALFDDEFLTDEDLRTGRFDGAKVMIAEVNYFGPLQYSKIFKRKFGKLGNVQIKSKGGYSFEIRGRMQILLQVQGPIYQPGCRNNLGDSRCKVDMTNHTFTSAISSITNQKIFFAPLDQPTNLFKHGYVHFTSGLNTGKKYEVKEWNSETKRIELELAADFLLSVNDEFTIHTGCDASIATCTNYFNNARRFNGEPYIPVTGTIINN